MARERQVVLSVVGLAIATVAAFVLLGVLGTVVLAVAATYMLLPVHRWLVRHYLPPYWSALVASLVGLVVSLGLLVPFVFALYLRRRAILDGLTRLQAEFSFTLGQQTVVVDAGPIREAIAPTVSRLAVDLVQQLSVLAAKFVVYGFVVFALLYFYRDLRALVFGPVPEPYHDVIDAIHRRIREVLFGHYVLVVVGGVTTYVAAVGVFLAIEYPLPYGLALLAAILWVLPFVSAAPLVFVLSAGHALNGEIAMALGVGLLGAVFLVAIPSFVVDRARSRLGDPRRLSQTLYFVGFVGGGLTLGLVGFVIGPLALTVAIALLERLAETDVGSLA